MSTVEGRNQRAVAALFRVFDHLLWLQDRANAAEAKKKGWKKPVVVVTPAERKALLQLRAKLINEIFPGTELFSLTPR